MEARAWLSALVPVFASAALAGAGSGIWTVASLTADLSGVVDRIERIERIQRRQAEAIIEIESEVDDNGEAIQDQSNAAQIAPGGRYDQIRVLPVLQRRPAAPGEKEVSRERGPGPDHPGPDPPGREPVAYFKDRTFWPARRG